MKKEKILKMAVVLIISAVLFAMSTNVFAADVDFFEDTTNQLNTTNTTNTVNTNTTNTNNYNTNLPKAGAPANTMVGIAITVLAVVAVFAYKKVNQYKNI